jgi:enoyl-CoA hydratase/carnithine racemase
MIRTRESGDLRVVTIDRPERRNALTPDGLDALEAAVAESTAPVVYLHGAGDAFCAGADLDVVASLSDPEGFARHGQRVASSIESSSSVVVAGIDGAARGGGVELALACDVRVATPDATFGEPGVEFGLFGAWGGTARLPRIVGEGDALDFSLSGRVVDAEEARRMGLVSRVVRSPFAVAEEIAANEHDALAVVKSRVRDRRDVERQEAAEAEAFAALVDAHAGDVAAVREGGRPVDESERTER